MRAIKLTLCALALGASLADCRGICIFPPCPPPYVVFPADAGE